MDIGGDDNLPMRPRPRLLGPQRASQLQGQRLRLLHRQRGPEHHHRLGAPDPTDPVRLAAAEESGAEGRSLRHLLARWLVSLSPVLSDPLLPSPLLFPSRGETRTGP